MLKEKEQTKVVLLAVFSVLTLSACGGGGSGGGDKPTASELTPGVFYIGRINTDGTENEGISLLSSNGEFVATFVKNNYTFGNMQFSGSGEISGDITQYQIGSPDWIKTPGSLSGQVNSAEMADLTASRSANPVSDSILYRNHDASNPGVTLEDLYTTFSMTESDEVITITVDAEGDFISSDRAGCIYSGKFDIPDTTVNVFEVTYIAEGEGCTDTHKNSDFSGLGTYNHADDPSDGELIFYSRNDEVAWMFKGDRS